MKNAYVGNGPRFNIIIIFGLMSCGGSFYLTCRNKFAENIQKRILMNN